MTFVSSQPGPDAGDDATRAGARYRPGYELAAQRILELMSSSRLAPGDRLPTEKDLGQQLGFSRPVIREAVKILSALGRLTVRKGVGIVVADGASLIAPNALDFFVPGDPQHVQWVFEFRAAQEAEAARLAAGRASPRDVAAIRDAVEAADRAAEADDGDLWSRADDAIHDAIAQASQNPFFPLTGSMARRLQRQALIIALRGRSGRSLGIAAAEHHRILDAIARGDAPAAGELMTGHILSTLVSYRDAIRRLLG